MAGGTRRAPPHACYIPHTAQKPPGEPILTHSRPAAGLKVTQKKQITYTYRRLHGPHQTLLGKNQEGRCSFLIETRQQFVHLQRDRHDCPKYLGLNLWVRTRPVGWRARMENI